MTNFELDISLNSLLPRFYLVRAYLSSSSSPISVYPLKSQCLQEEEEVVVVEVEEMSLFTVMATLSLLQGELVEAVVVEAATVAAGVKDMVAIQLLV
jgi:hypothetical protein